MNVRLRDMDLPVDIMRGIIGFMNGKTRSVICSVSKKMCELAIERCFNLDLTNKAAYEIILMNDYHLFVRMYTRKDVVDIECLLGYAARVCNVDLLKIFIEGKLPFCMSDYKSAGLGGSDECIKLIADYAVQLDGFVSYVGITLGAAEGGYIELVRKYMPKVDVSCHSYMMEAAAKNILLGAKMVNILIDEFDVADKFAWRRATITAIEYNNMDCLREMISREPFSVLEFTGLYNNINAFKLLVPHTKADYAYGWAFENACRKNHTDFMWYMLENYRHKINITAGFRILGVDKRIEFMEKCLEFGIEFNVDLWFMHTLFLSGGPGNVCRWILDHPTLNVSENLRREHL